ncbi:amylo-alpha-1,6-glucosidase [Acidobacteriota bacterium]
MPRKKIICIGVLVFILAVQMTAQEGLIPAFDIESNKIELSRLARPGTPFDKVGRQFAVLGDESGSFEAWAYPLKLFRNFQFSFLVGTSTRIIPAGDIVRRINVTPEATSITYVYQSFTVKAIYITPVDSPGAIILLKVNSTVPLTIICGFLPVLQPMWPAGIGGQYAYWNNDLKAYIISETTGKNHAYLGSPAASGISYTPAHMLGDNPSEFKIEIPDPNRVRHKFIPIAMSGGPGNGDDLKQVYLDLLKSPEELYRKSRKFYSNLSRRTMRIDTPEPKINLAFEWAKVSFDNLIVNNPNLGQGIVAGLGASGTSGRPGFGWFFGGDAYINSMSLLSYGAFSEVRGILAFTQKWQREDGKMSHELSQAEGYIDWWNDYPYGYIHGDTTPYFITAMYDYMRMTGDTTFIEESWDSLKRAFEWCLSTDANKDGLMDNKKAGLGALEYGALTGIETDIYLGAVWVRAAMAMGHLAKAAGREDYSRKAETIYGNAHQAFIQKFWDEELLFYAYAFNAQGERVKEISPWSAVGLMWELGTPSASVKTLEKLCSSELLTDWGIRSISNKSQYYQPLNYNYGAVWPFLTSWVTTALYKYHFPLQGFTTLMATINHTFDNSLGNVTEVFSGEQYTWPQEAVSHQGFSTAGTVLPTVRGLLGLEGDAQSKIVTFAPHFPADWDNVSIKGYRNSDALFDIKYLKKNGRISITIEGLNARDYLLKLAPALPGLSKIEKVAINGNNIEYETKHSEWVVQPEFEVKYVGESIAIEIIYTPGLEILPVIPDTPVGETNTGLKILRIQGKIKLDILVEGLAGQEYRLRANNLDRIERIEGASIEGSVIKFQMPHGAQGKYVYHTIKIWLKTS